MLSMLKLVLIWKLSREWLLWTGYARCRLTAKETPIASCEVIVVDVIYRIAVQGIFVGIIIKAGAASLKVTDLLFAFLFCKKINQENSCPSSLAVCCLLISIMKFSEHSNIYLDL